MKKKLFLCLALMISAITTISAQETITGKVLDSQGNPVLGAKVEIPGTDRYVITDPDGTFKLTADEMPGYVRISYVGLNTSVVKASPEMLIYMKERKQAEESDWRPMAGVNVTFGEEVVRAVYGLTAGVLSESRGVGFYARGAFLNLPNNYTLDDKHKFFAITLGGMARVYKPLYLSLGAGCSIHKISTNPNTTNWDKENGTKAHFIAEIGLALKVKSVMIHGGSYLEANKQASSEWYPFVGLNYCF